MICRYFKEGAKLDVAGLNEITVLIDRSETELTEVGMNSWWPGLDGPPHKHEQKEQLFFVVSGQGSVRVGDEVWPAKPGDLFYIPANVVHQTVNKGHAPLEYLLVNAFLNSEKEGHATFAEHVNVMKATRKLQAETQRVDAGSGQPQVASKVKGKHLTSIPALKRGGASSYSKAVILDNADTQRTEAVLVSLSSKARSAPEIYRDREQTLFVMEGTGSITAEKETKVVKRGDVVYVPRNTSWTAQAGEEGLTCLSLNVVQRGGEANSP